MYSRQGYCAIWPECIVDKDIVLCYVWPECIVDKDIVLYGLNV